jgi:hypothetical protein
MSQGYDPAQRRAATRLTLRNPRWLILWGTHSRIYWAYPRFEARPGTIVSAPTITDLLTGMRQTELATQRPHRQFPS